MTEEDMQQLGALLRIAAMHALPKTAKAAKALGLKTFYNAKPCRRGHKAPRRVFCGYCTACDKINARAARARLDNLLINNPFLGARHNEDSTL